MLRLSQLFPLLPFGTGSLDVGGYFFAPMNDDDLRFNNNNNNSGWEGRGGGGWGKMGEK